MRVMKILKAAAAAAMVILPARAALAETLEIIGQPTHGAMVMQPASSSIAVDQQWLDDMILYIMTGITVLVVLLLAWVIIRYNARANSRPRQFSHNSPLEIMWTITPVLILLFIGSFSGPILKKQQTFPDGDVVIKVTGNQWYWTYEYPNEGIAPFDSYMIGGLNLGGDGRLTPEVVKQLEAAGYTKDQFLLATDTAVVVPVGKKVLLQITGNDVIHSWAMPSMAIKQDAVPGRIAQAWFAADREGIYFGQCSELCGKAHAYMPITLKVVSPEAYEAWVAQAKQGDVILAHDLTAGDAGTDLAANE